MAVHGNLRSYGTATGSVLERFNPFLLPRKAMVAADILVARACRQDASSIANRVFVSGRFPSVRRKFCAGASICFIRWCDVLSPGHASSFLGSVPEAQGRRRSCV